MDELTWRENEQLRAAAQKLLKQVKKLPEDTECLYYYDMHMNFLKLAVGKAGANKVAHTYKPQFDYIVIHNHPDNATLSPGDLKQLIDDDFCKLLLLWVTTASNIAFQNQKTLRKQYLQKNT